METAPYRVRRATVDDLPQLRSLWQAMAFTEPGLDKRLTEFQVAESPDGRVVGAVGLAAAGGQGMIHSEAFADFSVADPLRVLLWERLQMVAKNHGLFRLWTRETAPFWSHSGLVPASAEVLSKLPEQWKAGSGNWLTLQLREEISGTLSVEQEFQMFIKAERERTQSAIGQAKMLKTLATALAIILAIVVVGAALYLLRRNPLLLPH